MLGHRSQATGTAAVRFYYFRGTYLLLFREENHREREILQWESNKSTGSWQTKLLRSPIIYFTSTDLNMNIKVRHTDLYEGKCLFQKAMIAYAHI